MGPCSRLLPEQNQLPMRSRPLCPHRALTWRRLLTQGTCLRSTPSRENSSAKLQKMGLPVLWASLGPEQKQQVARLPHPPKQPTCAHFPQSVCGGRGESLIGTSLRSGVAADRVLAGQLGA